MQSTSDYPASYYAATRNDDVSRPALDGDVRTDVCIVGGGFSGINVAIELAERGYDVVLLEQHRIGWGASGRNGGQLQGGLSGEGRIARNLGSGSEEMLWTLAYRGQDIIRDRIRRYGIACDLTWGHVACAARPRHVAALEEELEAHAARGLGRHLELVDKSAMPGVIGTDRYHGGLINRLDGHLHPMNLVRGEARAAELNRARLFENTTVLDIVPDSAGSGPCRVRTADGVVTADAVVIAGNAYHRLMRRRLAGYVLPTGSYIIATEPLDTETRAAVSPRGLSAHDTNVVLDYYRVTVDGRMLFGGRANYSNRDPRDLAKAMRPRMLHLYPALKDAAIEFAWGGKLGITVTRIPHIGRMEGNVYWLQGYSGHGVNQTHIFAEIVAEAVRGTLERFDAFARLPQFPLPFGGPINSALLALGMMWYRLRDAL